MFTNAIRWVGLISLGLNMLMFSSVVAQESPDANVQSILLWPEGAPGAIGDEATDIPSLTVYVPKGEHRVGTAVVVCPGGGYAHLAMDHEGEQIAAWLNALGITAFVLTYRIGPRYQHPAPLLDAQRALRYVRLHAEAYGVQMNRIGIWGFSAGGHLASTAGTHFDAGTVASADPIEQVSSRPDFMILAYPVITMTESYMHKGSKRHLLGEAPDPELALSLSNDLQVTPQTPPTFLFHTHNDQAVPAENSVAFYLALKKAGVPAELHLYEQGSHGVGLAQDDPVLSTWPDRLADWLAMRGVR